jgi:hypothetical protein
VIERRMHSTRPADRDGDQEADGRALDGKRDRLK